MELNPGKMLSTCSFFKQEESKKENQHWSSSKIFAKKRLSKSFSVNNYSVSDSNVSVSHGANERVTWKSVNRPTISVKYVGIAYGRMGILSKKMLIPYKNEKVEWSKPEIKIENRSVFHTFARPKLLVAMGTKGSSSIKKNLETKDCKMLLRKPKKIKRIRVSQSKIEFPSRKLLERHEFFHEPYLESVSNKYSMH